MKKKRYLAIILALVTISGNSFNVFASYKAKEKVSTPTATEATEEETIQGYEYEYINSINTEGREVLDFDTALKKAYANSATLRKTELSLEIAEDEMEDSYWGNVASTSETSLTNMLSLITKQLAYKQTSNNEKIQKIALENNLKDAFITIINTERENEVTQMTLDIEKKNLDVYAAQKRLGMMTEQAYNELVNTYNKNVAELEKSKKNVEQAYTTLNTLIGASSGKKYILYIEPEVVEFTVPTTLEQYANNKVLSDLNVKNYMTSVESAENSLDAYIIGKNGTYQSLKNDITTSKMSLAEYKKQLYNKIIAAYDDIKDVEADYKILKSDYEVLKTAYEIAQKKYELKTITEIELLTAKKALASKESAIIAKAFEHIQKSDALKETTLLGSAAAQ